MAPKIIDKEAKRERILQAAIKVFAERGAARTRMEDIAGEAGIGKGTIYEYFRSKEEIFSASFHHLFKRLDQMVATRMTSITEPEEKLILLFHSFIDVFDEYPFEFFQITMDFWAEGIRTKDEEKIKLFDMEKLYDEYRGLIISILKEGMNKGIFKPDIDPYYVASSLLGASDGLMLQLVLKGPARFDYKKSLQTLVHSFLHGIKR